jgi:hAT family C-terminal dimerisation region
LKYWEECDKYVAVIEPVMELLRLVDGERPTMGKVYSNMYKVEQAIEDAKDWMPGTQAQDLAALWHYRWDFMHSDIHSAAYLLDPEFWDTESKDMHPEVMTGFLNVLDKYYFSEGKGSSPQAVRAHLQFFEFRKKRVAFANLNVQQIASKVPAHEWWEEHGNSVKELQFVAVRVLSQACAASACERNWSTFGFVHNKVRNRMDVQKAADLVFVHSNLRLLRKAESEGGLGFVSWDNLDFDEVPPSVPQDSEPEDEVQIVEKARLRNVKSKPAEKEPSRKEAPQKKKRRLVLSDFDDSDSG